MFTYSGDPSKSSLDALRFAINDTDEKLPMLQDAELNYILDTYSNTRKQQAIAFRQCATFLARKPIERRLGPESENNSKRLAYYEKQAELLESQTALSGTPPTPVYSQPVVFDKNMMSNGE